MSGCIAYLGQQAIGICIFRPVTKPIFHRRNMVIQRIIELIPFSCFLHQQILVFFGLRKRGEHTGRSLVFRTIACIVIGATISTENSHTSYRIHLQTHTEAY